MNSFAGIAAFRNPDILRRYEDLLRRIIGRNGSGSPQVDKTASAIFVQIDGMPPRAGAQSLFAAAARLDNRNEVAAAIGERAEADDAELIRKSFAMHGDRGIARLVGAFAFAHWNEQEKRLTLARDCLGERSLFFHCGDGFVAFASHLPDLLAFPDVPRRVDEVMIANFVALNHHERERTLYRGVDRVPSRAAISITSQGAQTRYYWFPSVNVPPPFDRDEDYVHRARELFDRAVSRSLRDEKQVAIYTSGGLDSSAIAATAARLGHDGITCYTLLPPEQFNLQPRKGAYLDEKSKVDALGRMHPSLTLKFSRPSGASRLLQNSAELFAARGMPVRNVTNLGWDTGEFAASDGNRLILTGVRGNFGLSWGGDFSLAELARDGRIATLLREARAIAGARRESLLRVIARDVFLRMAPRSLQKLALKASGRTFGDVFRSSLLNPAAIDALQLREAWAKDAFEPRRPRSGDPVQFRSFYLFDFLQFSRDNAAMLPVLTGADWRSPHGDRDLLEFCLAVPEHLYRRQGISRWFARQVFADRLPPEILNETRRGVQAPDWFAALDARKPMVAAEIERIGTSPIASRILDQPRMKRLLDEWPKDACEAEARREEYRFGLERAIHVAQFVRWVEGGNA